MILTEPTDESLPGIPHLDYGLTPITDFTFQRQGWTKVMMNEDTSKLFYTEEDVDIIFNGDDGITKEELDKMMEENPIDGYEELFENDNPFNNRDSSNPLKPFMSGDDEEDGGDEDAYFWILKLPRDLPIDFRDDCPILMSTISDEEIDGLNEGEYIVQFFSPFELGTCRTEEEVEILYRALTGKDIYDF